MYNEAIVPVLGKVVERQTVKMSEDREALIRRCGLLEKSEVDHEPSFLAWIKPKNTKGLRLTKGDRKHHNPFVINPQVDTFKKRAEETLLKQQEKEFLSKLPVHERSTLLSRRRCCSAQLKSLREEPECETEHSRRDTAPWKTAISNGHRKDRESLQDYMARQKDMFMVQYALAVKKEHIQELKTASEREQLRMKHAERDLDEGAKAFEEFLKVNDQNSVDAVKLAEKEMMAKLEKTAEIKKLTSKIMTVKSDISRNQEVLNEYRAQKKFLKAVAPPEWREEQKRKRAERRRAKQTEGKNKANLHPSPSVKGDPRSSMVMSRRNSKKMLPIRGKPLVQVKTNLTPEIPDGHKDDSDVSDSDEEPEIYFKDPQEMLNILADLEDQNLSYIQNFQGTEEAMEEINSELSKAKNKMTKEMEVLKKQMEILQAAIDREKEKTRELTLKSKIFSFGEFRADKQDVMLNQLHAKVREVYRCCVGDVEFKISTLQMLASIENKMLEILDALELMPQDKVKKWKATKEKEARMRLRDEMKNLERQQKEERLKLALERATSTSKKQAGKKLMRRSEPPTIKKKGQRLMRSTKEQEDFLYFFT